MLQRIFYMVCAFLPIISFAHVKWFTHLGIETPSYSLFDIPVLTWIVIAGLIVGVFYLLEKYSTFSISIPEHIQKTVLTLADIGFGISLLLFSISGFIFAPNIIVDGTLGYILLIVQAIIGLSYMLGIYTRESAILLIIMYCGGIYDYGFGELMDAFEILGFGIYGLITGHPRWNLVEFKPLHRITKQFHEYSVPILRVFVGLNLIILGFSEKILRPDLGIEFLQSYAWNFTQYTPFPISDYWFVFSAGMGEVLLGILFVLGLMTRVTTLLLSIFLITTLILLGPIELIGHLPHFSIALVLIILGSGKKWVAH